MPVLLSHLKLQKLQSMVSAQLRWESHLICIRRYFERERGYVHVTVIIVYCYSCSILLLVSVPNL